MTKPRLSIIVFAYDEAENVQPVLRELRAYLGQHHPETQLVFVDDGSRDGTSAQATAALSGSGAVLLRHEHNRGIGAALKTGIRHCQADWVTFLPADGQIPPSAISTLLGAAADGEVDLVFSNYQARDDGAHRTLLSWGVRVLILALHGVQLRCEGPYLFRRALFQPEVLRPDSFFLNFEFPIRMLTEGKRVRSVEIPCRKRQHGSSKSTGLTRILGVARDLVDFRVRRLRERPSRGWRT
ncbi:MAG: glycosyltransferase family 2 protein [Polyangiales bacterium]